MPRVIVLLCWLLIAICTFSSPSLAARSRAQVVKGKLTPPAGIAVSELDILLLDDGGATGVGAADAKRKYQIETPGDNLRLYVTEDSTSPAPVILAIRYTKNRKFKYLAYPKAIRKGVCDDEGTVAMLGVRPGRKSITVDIVGTNPDGLGEIYYAKSAVSKKLLNSAAVADVDDLCIPEGARSLGVSAEGMSQMARLGTNAEDPDADGILNAADDDDDNDGMANRVDADNDADGVLDNDDSDSRDTGASGSDAVNFWMFSNFHLGFENSYNANAMSVTSGMVDAALAANGGLAIQVVGNGLYNVELDCGLLGYCSAGGTGRAREPYPNGAEFPEELDSDSDGLGTITPGVSNDFQLGHYATASEIQAGDVLIQWVTNPTTGVTTRATGMLNFVFHTTPAVTAVDTGTNSYSVTYPVTAGSPGTRTNPFLIASGEPGVVTLTVWRPQKPDGSGGYTDLGNLRLITNMPQGPCEEDSNGQCITPGGTGPGLCPSTVYSGFDSDLTLVSDGLQDTSGDQPADPANTFTYTIDLDACVSAVGNSFDAGETLFVPIQMMNNYGDNAAQNIYFKKAN